MKIHQLAPEIVAKIAAGEVIERPIFAVKELVENAIDAHATDITIVVEEGGLKKIQVTDNGEGMSKEDVRESYKPHTTSKILEDIVGIKSLGFRGEALASLAAVSNLTIRSRTQDSKIGYQIQIQEGKVIKESPVGMSFGTSVIAQHLFSTTPARKKFLKSHQSELRHIVDIVNHYAVAYPAIRFSLFHNKRWLIDFPPSKTVNERIKVFLGETILPFFLPLSFEESYIRLSGFIAKPQLHSSTTSKQFLFVNGRKVTDKVVSLAVKEAFGTMLEPTSYPQYILFLNIPYEMVDNNVHPRKEQIAFMNSQFVFQAVKQAISELLHENNLTFQNLSWKRTGVGTTDTYAAKLLKDALPSLNILKVTQQTQMVQFHQLYIMAEINNGILLIDQHAAHERILFEKLKNEFVKQKKKRKSTQLKNPVVLHLSYDEHLLLEEHKKIFQKLGFVITKVKKTTRVISARQSASGGKAGIQKKVSIPDLVGDDIHVVTHIPYLFHDRNPEEFVKSILDRVKQDLPIEEIDKVSEEMIAFIACREAKKAGDSLSKDDMIRITQDLEKTANNATCPHGRPTKIFYSLTQLNTMFGR